MTLQDLRYLVAVGKYLHFGKAAEASCISQPTLSMQLKKLERFLGANLIERTNKQVLITPLGKEIIERAKIILDEQKQIIDLAQELKDPLRGSITIGVFPTLGPYLLPKIMPALTKKLPYLKIFLIEEQSQKISEKLLSGEIDAVFLAYPLLLKNVTIHDIFQEEFFLAVYPSHRLAHRKLIQISDIKEETLLLLEDGHCFRDQVLEVCALTGAKENPEFRATSLETLRYMVKAKAGITLMPKIGIQNKEQGIVYIPFKKPKPQRKIGMIWRNSNPKKQVLNTIKEIIKQSLFFK